MKLHVQNPCLATPDASPPLPLHWAACGLPQMHLHHSLCTRPHARDDQPQVLRALGRQSGCFIVQLYAGLQRCPAPDGRYLLQASNGVAGSHRAWPDQAQQSSSSVYQAEEDSLSQSERQQQQYWQAFTQSLGRAPEQDAAHMARAAHQEQQDARVRMVPGQATQLQPQPSLPAVPEGRHVIAPYLHLCLSLQYLCDEQPASQRSALCA